jgi:hypothetical protein
MPDLGIGEALAAFAPELFAGAADAGGLAAGAGEAAAAGTSIADIVGTGAGLAGGATGLEGTLLAGGVSGADIASGAALGTAGLGALGTAADFLAAPAASGFDAAALTPGIGTAGGGAGVLSPTVPPPQPSAVGGASSVFDTGTSGISGVSTSGALSPGGSSVIPGGTSASALAAPAGTTAQLGVDPTALGGTASAGANATGTAGGAAAAPSSSIDSLLGKAGDGVLKSLTSNPLGTALGAAGLGYNIYSGQKQTANQNALTADANTATGNSTALMGQGEALQQYLTNGTLPPAYQQQVDQAIADAKTSAISNAAAQGQPTDPTQNTALAATLAKIDASRSGMQTQVASQLFSSGSSLISAGQGAAGLSGSLYQTLVQNDTTQAANTGKAIATLAAALNGKSTNTAGNVTVSTG